MASFKITLRPTSDVSSGHNKSSGSNAYSLLNEKTADNDSTYISQSVTSASSTTKTTVCKVGGTAPNKFYYISTVDATLVAKATNSGATRRISPGIRTSSTGNTLSSKNSTATTSYASYTSNNDNTLRGYYQAGTLPNLWVVVETTGAKESKGSNFELRVTQAYVTISANDAYVCRAVAVGRCTATVNEEYTAGAARTWTATVQSGNTFIGWLDEINYQKYQAGNSYTILSTELSYTSGTISSDTTLYAVATAPITVNAVATTGVSSATVAWSASDNAYKWQATVSSGYTFLGWLDATNYQAYQNGGSYSVLSSSTTYLYTPTSDTTLYAVALIPQRNFVIHNSANGTAMYRENDSDPWTSIAGGQTGTVAVPEDDGITLKVVPQASYDLCRLVEEVESSSERSRTSIDFPTYKYTLEALDAQGNTAEKIVFDAIAEKQYTYDGNGNLIGEEDLDGDLTVQIEALLNEIYTNGLPLGDLPGDMNVYLYYSQGLSRLFTNANGVWKKIVSIYHKESGAWVQSATGIRVNILGRNLQENEGLEDGDYIIFPKEE